MAKLKLKPSRAKWSGSWYKRIGKSSRKGVTWRNKNTGDVSKSPGGRVTGTEPTHYHNYGATGLSRPKAQRLIQFYKPKKRR